MLSIRRALRLALREKMTVTMAEEKNKEMEELGRGSSAVTVP